MPPRLMNEITSYEPMVCPGFNSAFSFTSNDAATSNAGWSIKPPLCSCDAINDSTSLRKSSSPEHAREMNRPRSSGRYVIAELKISLTCCQRSGVIRLRTEFRVQALACLATKQQPKG